MSTGFRWMIGGTLVIVGLFFFVAWAASLHSGPFFRPEEPSHWLANVLILLLCLGGTLILTKGWPLRK